MKKPDFLNHAAVALTGLILLPLIGGAGYFVYAVRVWAPAMRVDPGYEAGEDGLYLGAYLGTAIYSLGGLAFGILWCGAVAILYYARRFGHRRRLTNRCS